MKKTLFIASVILCGFVNAQKGSILVEGNISYNNENTKLNVAGTVAETKVDAFSFNPTLGYQFTDHLIAGVRLGFDTQKQTASLNNAGTTINIDAKSNDMQYGVFGRYIMPLSEVFEVFGDLDVYAKNSKLTIPNTTGGNITYTETKANGFGVKFTPNLFINMKNAFGLNFNIGGIGYETNKEKDVDMRTNSFGFSFGKGVTVGISKRFK